MTMTAQEKLARSQKVLKLHRAGVEVAGIAERVGLAKNTVRDILNEAGALTWRQRNNRVLSRTAYRPAT